METECHTESKFGMKKVPYIPMCNRSECRMAVHKFLNQQLDKGTLLIKEQHHTIATGVVAWGIIYTPPSHMVTFLGILRIHFSDLVLEQKGGSAGKVDKM
ncbi:hypothetical protein C0J52_20221 [Blattella germanica]|nr:hypothetical protein C0J52_20221 [Blattella germanica]